MVRHAVRQAIRQAHGPEQRRRTHGPERLKALGLVEGLTTLSGVEGEASVIPVVINMLRLPNCLTGDNLSCHRLKPLQT